MTEKSDLEKAYKLVTQGIAPGVSHETADIEGLAELDRNWNTPSMVQENQKMKEAIDLLTKPEWVEWAQNMIPNCPKWQQVRRAMGEAEIGFDDWGVYASTFVKLAAKDAL